MATHMSIRLAWHSDGWNGHICKKPCENSYCIGQHSYPGDLIAETRDLDFETAHTGESCSEWPCKTACGFSVNAFGNESITVRVDPALLRKTVGMFMHQMKNGQDKMVSVSVVEEDRIIYISNDMFNLYEKSLSKPECIELRKTFSVKQKELLHYDGKSKNIHHPLCIKSLTGNSMNKMCLQLQKGKWYRKKKRTIMAI